MPDPIAGLHHVTAIAGAPRANVAFYTGVLSLRLVKRTVNFDDPGTWHLYYGDALGRPGTAMTFFPWPDAVPGRAGAGMTSATAFAVPPGSLDVWMGRFADLGLDFGAPVERFGERVLPLADPDGLALELVERDIPADLTGWPEGPVPPEHAVRSFDGVTLALSDPAPTAGVLRDVLGYDAVGEEGGRLRFRASDRDLRPLHRPRPDRGARPAGGGDRPPHRLPRPRRRGAGGVAGRCPRGRPPRH
jgi:glyoxalase family protein